MIDLKGATTPYSLRVPTVAKGSVVHVTSQPGSGTKGFAVNADKVLTFNGGAEGKFCFSTRRSSCEEK